MVYILIFFLLTWENFNIFWRMWWQIYPQLRCGGRQFLTSLIDVDSCFTIFSLGIWLIICRDLIMGWAACSRIVKFLLDPMIFFLLCTCWTYTSWKTTPCVCTSNISLYLLYCTLLQIRGFIICLFKGIFLDSYGRDES